MKIIGLLVVAFTVTFCISISSCKNTMTPGLDQVVFPDTGHISYVMVQQLFNVGCIYSGCHNQTDQAGGLDLTYYDSWLKDAGVIIPRDTTSSKLIQYVEGRYYHEPDLLTALTPNQIMGLKRWIMQGAGNN